MSEQNLVLTGMILKVMPVGEYDKRIILLSRERGKVTGFVRGARRAKSSLQAASNLFVFGRFEAYEGRSAYTIVKAEVRHYFREIAADYDRTCYGSYFLELADYFCVEQMDAAAHLNLLYVTLQAMLRGKTDLRLIRRVYELRMLYLNGTYPDFFTEGEITKPFRMDPGPTARYTLQYIVSAPVSRLYAFTLKPEVFDEVDTIIGRLIGLYVDRPLNTVQFLKDST